MFSDEEYKLEFFELQNFRRYRCESCKRFFWSLEEKKYCGEPPCVEYTFIGNPPTNRKLNLHEMRELYLQFFEKEGHKRIKRYPIVARWRGDVFFTQASIYNFQPWVLDGVIEPPGNPLTMSQPCIRFNDIDNVGKTGRHFTMFEMLAHHAFNTKKNRVYFKDRTVELCYKFLVKELSIPSEKISFIEEEWSGGGNSGPCFEVLVDGCELATLVFIMYKDENGRKKLDMEVVDPGYGLERFVWLSQGTTSAYEAVFPYMLPKMKKALNFYPDETILSEYSRVAGIMRIEEGKDLALLRKKTAERLKMDIERLEKQITPLEHLYAICDHTRGLMFLLNDGVVPSNVKEGYFARLLLRRALRNIKILNLPISLEEFMEWQIEYFGKEFPEFLENKENILELVKVEIEKYNETLRRGRGVVKRTEAELKKLNKEWTFETFAELYESHGLPPEIAVEFAEGNLKAPPDFYIRIAERYEKSFTAEKKELKVEIPDLDTELLCYENNYEFYAKILAIADNFIILDKTYFYPEGGGQLSDRGTIKNSNVIDVQKYKNTVLHRVDSTEGLNVGEKVFCKIDVFRRAKLTLHHTATHIINASARKILGNHVWQAGAQKLESVARLDITHYALPSEEEIAKIEKLANEIVRKNIKIECNFFDRDIAESKFGYRLYQGGAVPGRKIRVVDIKDFDAEACGGTHCNSTGEVGLIKITNVKRIQDGVLRLEYKAGEPAIEYIQSIAKNLSNMCELFHTTEEKFFETAKKVYEEWKEGCKEIEKLRLKITSQKLENLVATAEKIDNLKIVKYKGYENLDDLMVYARLLTKKPDVIVFLSSIKEDLKLIIARSDNVDIDCSSLIKKAIEIVGGSGGGKKEIAQLGNGEKDKIEDMFAILENEVRNLTA